MSRTDEAILFEAGGVLHSILLQATRLGIWSDLGRLRPFKVVFQGGPDCPLLATAKAGDQRGEESQ